jgi:peptidoglycan/xylan/chitin deacetylase (PgdA/CDA1 family)
MGSRIFLGCLFAILIADLFAKVPLSLYGWVIAVYVLFLAYGSFFIQGCVFVKAICRIRTDQKVVSLTFDDGPDARYTASLLEVLRTHNVKAVFFCIGKLVHTHPELIRQIDAEGHLLGLHSHAHEYWYGFKPNRQIMADLKQIAEAIAKIIGMEPRWFRPPYGVTNPAIGYAVFAGDYQVIGWSVWSFVTLLWSASATLTRIVKRVSPGGVILLHDSLKDTPLVVNELIKALKTQGYRIERLDHMIDNQPYR